MRVAMYYSNSDVRLQELPRPEIGEGEILMRTEAAGICGTDVLEWYRTDKVPLVLGHEVAGIVEEVGKGVKRYQKGERIVAAHHVPCGECNYCKAGHETVCDTLRKTKFHPGGFSEFIRLPSINVECGIFRLPDDISFEEGTFVEPLACVVRGQKIAGMKKGKSVLVIGSGISGLLHIQLARANGASRIVAVDIIDYRIKAAKKFGADLAINADSSAVAKGESLPDRQAGTLAKADIVILCTGATSAIAQALASVERGGTVLFFAATDKGATFPLSVNDTFWRNEITLTSSYAGAPQDHIDALELIRGRRVNVRDMITHRFALADAGKGFKLVAEAKESIKVIIEPQR